MQGKLRLLGVLALALALVPPLLAGQATGAWYRGDLHAHSTYSDGDSSVAAVVAAAELSGLDFFAITDHDSRMGGTPLHWSDAAYRSATTILLYGIEWTTGRGHANLWAARPFAYGELWLANRAQDPEIAAALARREGALFSIDHPRADICCPWRLQVPDGAAGVEIWNGPYRFPSGNRKAAGRFYDALLAGGRRVTAVGGSDSHQLKGYQVHFNPPGSPTTWVYAAARTAEAMLEGIRAGHVSMTYMPRGDRLHLDADADGDGTFELMAGDNAPAAGVQITLRAQVHPTGRPGEEAVRERRYVCLIYRNGRVVKRAILKGPGASVTFRDTPTPGTAYRAELRGAPRLALAQRLVSCRTLALTNPLYVGFRD
jgi:hypothetical protein